MGRPIIKVNCDDPSEDFTNKKVVTGSEVFSVIDNIASTSDSSRLYLLMDGSPSVVSTALQEICSLQVNAEDETEVVTICGLREPVTPLFPNGETLAKFIFKTYYYMQVNKESTKIS